MTTVPTSTPSPVSRDIDPATIRRLYHEEGMTMKAIAELCGICAATVSRYVGPVKKGKRAKAKRDDAIAKAAAEPAQPKVRPKRLVPSKSELKGISATFELDYESGTVLVRGSTFEMLMNREEMKAFIGDLTEACEFVSRVRDGVANAVLL